MLLAHLVIRSKYQVVSILKMEANRPILFWISNFFFWCLTRFSKAKHLNSGDTIQVIALSQPICQAWSIMVVKSTLFSLLWMSLTFVTMLQTDNVFKASIMMFCDLHRSHVFVSFIMQSANFPTRSFLAARLKSSNPLFWVAFIIEHYTPTGWWISSLTFLSQILSTLSFTVLGDSDPPLWSNTKSEWRSEKIWTLNEKKKSEFV